MKTLEKFLAEARDKNLLGTAPSLNMMKDLLRDFWHGGEYDFKQVSQRPDKYLIIKNGKEMSGHILKKGNRYQFRMDSV